MPAPSVGARGNTYDGWRTIVLWAMISMLSAQDHGVPVRFRNIWIRELRDDDGS